jgi:tetratricopeptide (TPR) repeat protein
MGQAETPVDSFAMLPDPAQAGSVDDIVERLRLLKVWAGDPSYETIKDRVNAAWRAAGRPAGEMTIRSTVANCFTPGRRRLNTDLVLAIVAALHPEIGYVTQWRQALRAIGREIEAVAQVRVQDSLPRDLVVFTGRRGELDELRRARQAGDSVVISAIEGMAGVGKTQLAVHAGHLLHQERPFDQVLFVNLRGFHPDPTQPPADPAAVLDGFLRLLGMPGQQIPHGLDARSTAFRERLAGVRALIVLDNAANAEQVRPLLPDAPGCLTLITSRRSLTELQPGSRLAVDVFSPDEAVAFFNHAVPGIAAGPDAGAVARIVARCGYLPLALSLIAGHIRNTPGWTLTDHADRLDERHDQRRLDSGVELALTLSYQHLPSDQQRALRLAALHPGQDLDAYAAAALTGADLDTARAWLSHLGADHLLQQTGPDRYTFHDLVRAYAVTRAHDEDPPAARRDALTRLFDHYLATAAAAMNTLHPADAHLRPKVLAAAGPAPELTAQDTALAWLGTERPTLIAVAAYTATHGWPGHTTALAQTLSRYLRNGYYTDALTLHGHAQQAARTGGDPAGQAHALVDIGFANLRLGRFDPAEEQFRQALDLFRATGDPAGEARVHYHLAIVAWPLGRVEASIDHLRQALDLYGRAGDPTGKTTVLHTLGSVLERSGRLPEAIDYCRQAMLLARQTGDRRGEAHALNILGDVEVKAGHYEAAGAHLHEALTRFRQLGNRSNEAGVLDSIGTYHLRTGRLDQAAEAYQQAADLFREIGARHVEVWPLNGLGETASADGRPADALTHHGAALTAAIDSAARDQQARAEAGLGNAHRDLGNRAAAREHYREALDLYASLGLPEADAIRAQLAALEQ